jgi:hypothetical protein
LKVIVWCRGYSPVLIDVPKLPESTYSAGVSPTPLPTMRLKGKILPATLGRSLAGFEVRVSYLAEFGCEFFKWWDCGVPQFEIDSTTIDPNNEFVLTLPAIADDPIIKHFQSLGRFRFSAEQQAAPYTRFDLDTSDGILGMVPSSRYPVLVIFRPVVR